MELKDFIQERFQKTLEVESVSLYSGGTLCVECNGQHLYLNEVESAKIEYDSDGIHVDVTAKKEDTEAAQLEPR